MEEPGLRVGPVSISAHEPRGVVLVGGEETGGRFALVETLGERGTGLPRHLHHWEDETIYVLEGALDVWVEGGWVEVPAGAAVFLARGVEHASCVKAAKARALVFLTPAGFEGFYREMGAAGSGVDRLVTTAARYGCEITGPAPKRPDVPEEDPQAPLVRTGRDGKTEKVQARLEKRSRVRHAIDLPSTANGEKE